MSETLLQRLKGERRRPEPLQGQRKRPHVVPYMHKISHNLKKVANRHHVPVVFSAPNKLSRLCARISSRGAKAACDKKHAKPFLRCAVGTVYEIPLSCGKVYIGQTGRCTNNRLREHSLSIRNGTWSHLPFHCASCGCTPQFDRTRLFARSRDALARELLEAFHIRKKGDS